jgi:hypothetical protein
VQYTFRLACVSISSMLRDVVGSSSTNKILIWRTPH